MYNYRGVGLGGTLKSKSVLPLYVFPLLLIFNSVDIAYAVSSQPIHVTGKLIWSGNVLDNRIQRSKGNMI